MCKFSFLSPQRKEADVPTNATFYLAYDTIDSSMSSTTTLTIDDVVQVQTACQDEGMADLVPFSTLLDGPSFAAVDNSGSTGGAPLRVASRECRL